MSDLQLISPYNDITHEPNIKVTRKKEITTN